MKVSFPKGDNPYEEVLGERIADKITQEDLEYVIYSDIFQKDKFYLFSFTKLITFEEFQESLKKKQKDEVLRKIYVMRLNSILAKNISNLLFLLGMRNFHQKAGFPVPEKLGSFIQELREQIPFQLQEIKQVMRGMQKGERIRRKNRGEEL